MNSPELAQKIAQFLFQPEDLTWYFLPALAGVFVIGSVHAVRHGALLRGRLATIRDEYAEGPARSRVQPRAYIQMCLEDDTDRRVVDGVPSLLVTIGILGTFLGLGIALQLAGGGLTTSESALASLDSLLETVAFKFQTSAWGILLSVVFQVLVVNPHHRWVERAHERAERAMLAAYLPAGEAMREALEPVISSLGQATQSVADTSKAMVVAMTEFQQSMDASTKRLESAMGALDGLGRRLEDAVNNMGTSVASTLTSEVTRQGDLSREHQESLKLELANVAEAVKDLQTTTAEVGPTLTSAVKKMQGAVTEGLSNELRAIAEAIAKLDGAMKSLQGGMKASLGSVVTAIGKMESAQESSIKQLDEGLTDRLGEVATVLARLDKSLGDQLTKLNEELGTHLGATKKHTLELSVTMTGVREALEELEHHVGKLADVLDREASAKAAQELDDLLVKRGPNLGLFGVQVDDESDG